MSKLITLISREVKSYFYSPIAYVVLCFFLLLTGLSFYMGVSYLARGTMQITVVESFFDSTPFWFALLLIFPPITMRSFAEEFKLGTVEPLMTAPVRDWQVVLSKFLGALIFYMFLWLPSPLYFVLFQHIANVQAANSFGAYWGSYLLLLLIGMFFISVGCFASVLTQNQIIAAAISFVSILLFFFFGLISFFVVNTSPALRAIVDYFSPLSHMSDFSNGLIDSRRLVFYLSGTVLMLFLTQQVFTYRRWKS
jgi:ABC-2 type transport system permease protein